jgi:hypothetical protein
LPLNTTIHTAHSADTHILRELVVESEL